MYLRTVMPLASVATTVLFIVMNFALFSAYRFTLQVLEIQDLTFFLYTLFKNTLTE